MMNTALCDNWIGFSASIPGSGHIRRGLPCQDASAAITSPRPALIVCDGRGSASRSQEGAEEAVKSFQTQIAVFEPMLASILDHGNESQEQWETFSRIIYRTLMQTKLDLARETGLPEKEFDFTVAFAVIGSQKIGCFQVGDGAIVLRQNGKAITAFPPDKGEFANQTHFLRENGELAGRFHAALFAAGENSGVAITSDGPEHLMFKLDSMTPGRVFGVMFDDLHAQHLCRQDIMDYLTRREWENDPRGGDDRSLALLVQLTYPNDIAADEKTLVDTPADNARTEKPVGNESPNAENIQDLPSSDDEADDNAGSETESFQAEISDENDGVSNAPMPSNAQNENSGQSDGKDIMRRKMEIALKKNAVPMLLTGLLAAATFCAIYCWNVARRIDMANDDLRDENAHFRSMVSRQLDEMQSDLQAMRVQAKPEPAAREDNMLNHDAAPEPAIREEAVQGHDVAPEPAIREEAVQEHDVAPDGEKHEE